MAKEYPTSFHATGGRGHQGDRSRSGQSGDQSGGQNRGRTGVTLDPRELDVIITRPFNERGESKAHVATTYARFDRILADEVRVDDASAADIENIAFALRSIAKQKLFLNVTTLGRIAWIAHELMRRAGQGDLPHKSIGVEVARGGEAKECAAVWRRVARVIHAEISWRALGAEPKTTDLLASILVGEIGLGRTPMMVLDGAGWSITVRNTNKKGTSAARASRRKSWLARLFSS